VEMIAKVHIQAALREGITYLQRGYYTPPFKVMDITENKRSHQLHLMLMCASPGILDGDSYEMRIELAAHCSMQLHTQSYQRLFMMEKGAEQRLEVHLAEGAELVYLPHPAVPHERSLFTTRTAIYINKACTVIWGEVLTCGRKLNGEVFRFSKYHSITEIFSEERLVIRENLLMQPALIDVQAIGQLEEYTHQASMLFVNEKAVMEEVAEEVQAFLAEQKEICFGITAAPINGLVIRILGHKAGQLHECLQTIAREILHK